MKSEMYIYQTNQDFKFPKTLNIQNHVVSFKSS